MNILGLDIATTTGWAYYPDRNPNLITSGSFKVSGDVPEEKADRFAGCLIQLLNRHGKPDLCIMERPLRRAVKSQRKVGGLIPDEYAQEAVHDGAAILLNALMGSAVGVLRGYGIPWETVASQTWRKGFFPDRTKGADRADWKRLALKHCKMLGIDAGNSDEAEAVGIAMYGPVTQTWRRLREQVAA